MNKQILTGVIVLVAAVVVFLVNFTDLFRDSSDDIFERGLPIDEFGRAAPMEDTQAQKDEMAAALASLKQAVERAEREFFPAPADAAAASQRYRQVHEQMSALEVKLKALSSPDHASSTPEISVACDSFFRGYASETALQDKLGAEAPAAWLAEADACLQSVSELAAQGVAADAPVERSRNFLGNLFLPLIADAILLYDPELLEIRTQRFLTLCDALRYATRDNLWADDALNELRLIQALNRGHLQGLPAPQAASAWRDVNVIGQTLRRGELLNLLRMCRGVLEIEDASDARMSLSFISPVIVGFDSNASVMSAAASDLTSYIDNLSDVIRGKTPVAGHYQREMLSESDVRLPGAQSLPARHTAKLGAWLAFFQGHDALMSRPSEIAYQDVLHIAPKAKSLPKLFAMYDVGGNACIFFDAKFAGRLFLQCRLPEDEVANATANLAALVVHAEMYEFSTLLFWVRGNQDAAPPRTSKLSEEYYEQRLGG